MRKILQKLILFLFIFLISEATAQENRLGAPANQSSIEDRIATGRFELDQNSPNPFDGETEITFSTPVLGFVEFKIVNLIGKEILRQVMEAEPGKNSIHVNGSDLMPGVYVYSLSNGSQTLTRRMVISKK